MEKICSKEYRPLLMGLSIIIVTICHITQFLAKYKGIESSIATEFFLMGAGAGVDIFFFLSVVGLGFSYEKNSLGEFYKRRAIRIYPVYAIFLLIVISCFFSQNEMKTIALSALYHLSGIAIFRFTPTWMEWYIPALLVVYLLYPILYKLVEWAYLNRKRELFFLVVSILAAYAGRHVMDPLFTSRFPIIYIGILSHFYIREHKEESVCYVIAIAALIGVCLYSQLVSIALVIPTVLYAFDAALPTKNQAFMRFFWGG